MTIFDKGRFFVDDRCIVEDRVDHCSSYIHYSAKNC